MSQKVKDSIHITYLQLHVIRPAV